VTAPASAANPANPANGANGEPILTPAQRQRAYRRRRKHAMTDAIGEEDRASRVTLLSLLAQDLAGLENANATSMHRALRSSAKRILRVIVTRYAIELEDRS